MDEDRGTGPPDPEPWDAPQRVYPIPVAKNLLNHWDVARNWPPPDPPGPAWIAYVSNGEPA